MAKKVQPIPEGYTSVTPYLTIKGADKALEFYKKVFGAKETMRLADPGGSILHAEITIGGAAIMLHEENAEWGALAPTTVGGSASSVMLYVGDCDAVTAAAVAAGAELKMEVADQFYGDRCGNIVDPFGHKWAIATHIEDVPPDEIAKRARKLFGG